MTGRERFRHALDGAGLAFAPYVWERLPELVQQPTERWWQDPTIGRRLLVDVARLADADALFVAAAGDAAIALRESGGLGEDALDGLADTPEARCGYALAAALRDSAPFAVIAALPDAAWLGRELRADAPEAAEDALSDLARGFLDAGADALAVVGSDEEHVRAAAARAGAIAEFYGRPGLALWRGPQGTMAWVVGRAGAAGEVAVMSDSGEWPPVAGGLVVTAADVSLSWDAARLHAVGSARP